MSTQVASPAAPAQREAAGATPSAGARTSCQRATRACSAVMVGIPTLIQLVLVWIPLVLSVALSFTRWNALALSDIKPAGLSNYDFVLNNYPPFWPAVEHNIIWLPVPGSRGHTAGAAPGRAAGPEHPRQPDLPEHLLHSGDAVLASGRRSSGS